MKKLSVLMCFILIALLLSACGIPEEMSEEEILSDIVGADNFFTEYDLTVDSGTIVSRKVSEEKKTETIKLNTKASNNLFTYAASYTLLYVAENNIWILEEWKKMIAHILRQCPPQRITPKLF